MTEHLVVPLFGIVSTIDNPAPRCAALLNDTVVDLSNLWQLECFQLRAVPSHIDLVAIFRMPTLNRFAELPLSIRSAVRKHVAEEYSNETIPSSCLVPVKDVSTHLPMSIGNYVDFYCSLEHARNCAALVGGEVTDNFYTSPICYNGRACSLVPSPTPIHRPRGIFHNTSTTRGSDVIYGPSKKLDFELELGYFISKSLPRGKTLSIDEAPEHIFGFVLLNDWSTRDVQMFELRPLGPFHSKGFATSISPWIVPFDALHHFATAPKYSHEPGGLSHLTWSDSTTGTFNITVTASVTRNGDTQLITKSNLRDLYWSPFQQLTHLASSGSGIITGDLVGTGTISGSVAGSQGCLFEASEDGVKAISLGEGLNLTYLEDYDEVVLDAWCGSVQGGPSFKFAECRGQVLPAE